LDISFSPASVTTGFMAIRNGNGRVTLMTSQPDTKNPKKFVFSTNDKVTLDVVTQNGPSDASDVAFKIAYSVGHNDPSTTTPAPTTPVTPKQMASAKIFVLEVNAQVKRFLLICKAITLEKAT
jgi:hypothetical protein